MTTSLGWLGSLRTSFVHGFLHSRFGVSALAVIVAMQFTSRLAATDPPAGARTFDKLSVAGTTYTGVTVIDVSKRHVSFTSREGFATVLIDDLEPSARAKFRQREQETADNSPPPPKGEAPVVEHRWDRVSEVIHARERSALASHLTGNFTARHGLALSILGLGILVILAGQCWLIGTAFQTSVGWGLAVILGTFVIGIINLIFCLSHWEAAKRPVYLKLAGVGLVVAGCVILAG